MVVEGVRYSEVLWRLLVVGPMVSLRMFDMRVMTEAKIGLTVTSPGCVLQQGRVWMHELSIILLSNTFLDFHRSLAALKSNS